MEYQHKSSAIANLSLSLGDCDLLLYFGDLDLRSFLGLGARLVFLGLLDRDLLPFGVLERLFSLFSARRPLERDLLRLFGERDDRRGKILSAKVSRTLANNNKGLSYFSLRQLTALFRPIIVNIIL